MCTVPMMKPLFRAHVIVFYSRRDGRALGWGIYSEFPLSQIHDGTQTNQKLPFVVTSDSYEKAEKAAEFIVGNDVRLPGRNPRFLELSQMLRKTVLQEASHDTPSGRSFAQAAMGMIMGAILWSGCFSADLSSLNLKCDGVTHFCPDGLACVDGVCTSEKSATADMSVSGGSDGMYVDMSQSSADLAQAGLGCRSGVGFNVSGATSAFACPGMYEAGPDPAKIASHLCATGYSLCTLGSAVNLPSCATLGGFFLADVPTKTSFPTVSCGKASTETPGFAGCGSSTTGVYSVPTCNGFGRSMFYLGANNLVILTPNVTIDSTATNNDPKNGVLCCK